MTRPRTRRPPRRCRLPPRTNRNDARNEAALPVLLQRHDADRRGRRRRRARAWRRRPPCTRCCARRSWPPSPMAPRATSSSAARRRRGCSTRSRRRAAKTQTIRFVNLRETGGWSPEARGATPKIAALLAQAALPDPEPVPSVSYRSEGQVLIVGPLDAALRWADVAEGPARRHRACRRARRPAASCRSSARIRSTQRPR